MSTDTARQDLAERFHRGDETAFAEIYRLYSRPMFTTALSVLGDRELAADAVQRSFVSAWQAAGIFDPARDLGAWLFTITRRAAIDVYRRERKALHCVPIDGSSEVAMGLVSEGPEIEATWQAWRVREALDGLSPDERLVVQMAHFEGLPQTAIAGRLGIALGTVKSRTWRAYRKLADSLRDLRDLPGQRPSTSGDHLLPSSRTA
ncbi:RNA polymerase sigma factor [Kribbella sp. NPDC055071]